MSNFTLEQLLQLPPYDALLINYNEEHGTALNPRYVQLDEIIDSDGPELLVRLKANPSLPNSEEKRFINSAVITVNRMDIGALFVGPVDIPYSTHIFSHDVARVIQQRTGIVFTQDDFIDKVITPDDPILSTASTSLRWYGHLVIRQTPNTP